MLKRVLFQQKTRARKYLRAKATQNWTSTKSWFSPKSITLLSFSLFTLVKRSAIQVNRNKKTRDRQYQRAKTTSKFNFNLNSTLSEIETPLNASLFGQEYRHAWMFTFQREKWLWSSTGTVRGLRSAPKFGSSYGTRTQSICQCTQTRFWSVGGRAVRESVCRKVEGKFPLGTEARHRSVHTLTRRQRDVDKRTPNMKRRLENWSRTDSSTTNVG